MLTTTSVSEQTSLSTVDHQPSTTGKLPDQTDDTTEKGSTGQNVTTMMLDTTEGTT